MITRSLADKIHIEIQKSLNEAFDYIRLHSTDHDYILFLAEGEYKAPPKNNYLRLNPYTIDSREDRIKDDSRQKFFIRFMQTFYGFPKRRPKTDDNEYRLTMELMIYTHIWESERFLKQLYRFASLANSCTYAWNVEVPEMSKHLFIRKEVRDVFDRKGLSLGDVVTKGFHTSLRNAFAHSQYLFDDYNKKIHLDTFKGDHSWDIADISYDDWTKRFLYSALLSYYLYNIKHERRKLLNVEFNTDFHLIIHPINQTRFRATYIQYDDLHDNFGFDRR